MVEMVLTLLADAATHPHAPQLVNRKLLQWGRRTPTPNLGANTVRAQAATSQVGTVLHTSQ
jgi:hypothetical protein